MKGSLRRDRRHVLAAHSLTDKGIHHSRPAACLADIHHLADQLRAVGRCHEQRLWRKAGGFGHSAKGGAVGGGCSGWGGHYVMKQHIT